MYTHDLFSLLSENPNKFIKFEYDKGKFVEANYHITEVKNVKIDSVDCGGNKNAWNETIVQLWVASEGDKARQLTTTKSLQILEKVDDVDPIDQDAIVYFEYGNTDINVANFDVSEVNITDDFVHFVFSGISTQCKAADRAGSTCGTSTESSGCCSTSEQKVACC